MPGDLVRHAGTVDDITDELRTGRSAAARASLGRAAYGKLCMLLPVAFEPLQDAVVGALTEAVTGLESVADALRDTAATYQITDATAATRFDWMDR